MVVSRADPYLQQAMQWAGWMKADSYRCKLVGKESALTRRYLFPDRVGTLTTRMLLALQKSNLGVECTFESCPEWHCRVSPIAAIVPQLNTMKQQSLMPLVPRATLGTAFKQKMTLQNLPTSLEMHVWHCGRINKYQTTRIHRPTDSRVSLHSWNWLIN